MGYIADRWHRSRPDPGGPACEHRGKTPSSAHGKGKRWQARYDGPDGKERTSLFGTRVEAERHLVKQEHDKQTGSWLDPRAGRITVREFALDVWLPAQNVNRRTASAYAYKLERYLLSDWGTRELRSIRPSEAGAWQQSLTARYGLSGGTPNRIARIARSVFKLAVTDRVIAVSPFQGVPAPKLVKSPVHPPDVVEVRRMIEAAGHPRWAVMLELAALTGLRSGELRGLTVDCVDWLRRTVRVEKQLVAEAGRGYVFSGLKTGAGRRTIPLPRRAVELLSGYLAEFPAVEGGQWAGLVFSMPDRGPVPVTTLFRAMRSACKNAGLAPRHWHELRHHYASVLIAGGENPTVVQRRLGHQDISTTLGTYSHLFAEAEERTRDVLDAAWGGTFPESGGPVRGFPQVGG